MTALTVLPLFVPQATPLPAAPQVPPEPRVVWGDPDGDGRADAFALLPSGAVALLRNDGDGRLVDETAGSGLESIGAVREARWIDVDADGADDLFVVGADGARLWRNRGGAGFEDVTDAVGLTHEDEVRSAVWIELDGDGLPDLHLATSRGGILFRNSASGVFSATELALPAAEPALRDGSRPVLVESPDADVADEAGAADREPPIADDGATRTGGATREVVLVDDPSDPDAPATGSSTTSASSSLSDPSPAGPEASSSVCLQSITDQATAACLMASSIPTLGMLYPLGPELFIDSVTDNVGIGTTDPDHRLEVITAVSGGTAVRAASGSTTGVGQGVWGSSASPFGKGVLGIATNPSGVTTGVLGQAHSDQGQGVLGQSLGASGTTVGVRGLASSPDGIGVRGEHPATTGTAPGVLGETASTEHDASAVLGRTTAAPLLEDVTYAVRGEAQGASGTAMGVAGSSGSADGVGVWGVVAPGGLGIYLKGTGVVGSTDVDAAAGVAGYDLSSGGATGVLGTSFDDDGVGVSGAATSATGATTGVRGSVASQHGTAVHGENTALWSGAHPMPIGVRGTVTVSGVGVYAESDSGGNAADQFGSAVQGYASGSGVGVLGVGHGDSSGLGFGPLPLKTDGVGVYGIDYAASGDTVGVYGESLSSAGTGVEGHSSNPAGTGSGVTGTSAGSGAGVAGSTSGSGSGVMGSASGSGSGVMGSASGSGSGVTGTASGSGPGVTGSSADGTGVLAWTEGINTWGVHGYNRNPTTMVGDGRVGVGGESLDTIPALVFPAVPMGVWGATDREDGIGTYGVAVNASANVEIGVAGLTTWITGGPGPEDIAVGGFGGFSTGVLGDAAQLPDSGIGVQGDAGWQGVRGNATVVGSGVRYGGWFEAGGGDSFLYGVRASAIDPQNDGEARGISSVVSPVDGVAGQFVGDVDIIGTLFKTGGAFKIDHPLDPENQYLVHSFVESPEMMNVYNGTVELDARGTAEVELPEWFEALNRDFHYQLTPIGGPAPELHVATGVAGNRFTIAGGAPAMRVSWLVTGVRRDPYAEANRLQNEVPKAARERGLYLHPEAYGLPPERGIHWALEQAPVLEREAELAEMRQRLKERPGISTTPPSGEAR